MIVVDKYDKTQCINVMTHEIISKSAVSCCLSAFTKSRNKIGGKRQQKCPITVTLNKQDMLVRSIL